MARMPGAIWKPLAANWNQQPRIKAWDIFCLHTMVGGLVGTDGYFRVGNGAGYGGTESHFGVGPDGTIYQWQDTDFQADANYLGNWHVISSENADTGAPFPKWGGSDVPPLTPEQVEANAEIAAWLNYEHGIPLDLIPDAKPGRRGIGWHRLGVPGYAVAGAELWSSSPGKVCPGDRRIAQIPLIRNRALEIANGDDMPLNDDDIRRIQAAVWDPIDVGDKNNPHQRMGNMLAEVWQTVTPGIEGVKNHGALYRATLEAQGRIAGLEQAIKQVAAAPSSPVDLDAVFKAAQDGARSIIEDLRVVPGTNI